VVRRPSMTLMMGARCIDGVVLVADRKINSREESDPIYGNKITGEITEVLTGFSGDRGTFELFRNCLRRYAKEIDEQIKRGSNKEINIDEIIWHIHEIKMGFRNKPGRYKFELMVGISSKYFTNRKSTLNYFYDDGGFIPVDKCKAIGEGKIHALYYLQRYYYKNMTMRRFAQLGDFIIRYIDNEQYRLDNTVGLDPKYPYPQIIYIPDDPDYCKPYNNNGQIKFDCTPTQKDLKEFKSFSEKKLGKLYGESFFNPTTVTT
jgi:20S proteasome alpha/beta subunit